MVGRGGEDPPGEIEPQGGHHLPGEGFLGFLGEKELLERGIRKGVLKGQDLVEKSSEGSSHGAKNGVTGGHRRAGHEFVQQGVVGMGAAAETPGFFPGQIHQRRQRFLKWGEGVLFLGFLPRLGGPGLGLRLPDFEICGQFGELIVLPAPPGEVGPFFGRPLRRSRCRLVESSSHDVVGPEAVRGVGEPSFHLAPERPIGFWHGKIHIPVRQGLQRLDSGAFPGPTSEKLRT